MSNVYCYCYCYWLVKSHLFCGSEGVMSEWVLFLREEELFERDMKEVGVKKTKKKKQEQELQFLAGCTKRDLQHTKQDRRKTTLSISLSLFSITLSIS